MSPQKRATIVASSTALFLTILKTIIGFLSGSVAIMASAVDSGLDLLISLFNMFAINKSEEKADKKFNYGKGKIEALAALFEGLLIFASAVFLLYVAIKKINNESTLEHLNLSIIVMIISSIVTFFLVIYLKKVAKQTESMVIESDALHYKTDLLTNISVLLALVVIHFTSWHIVDAIMGITIASYIMFAAFGLIRDGVFILLDASLDEEIVSSINDILSENKEIKSYHDLRTRKSGNNYFIDAHLVFDPNITIKNAHIVCDEVEMKFRKLKANVKWIINIHLDYYNDSTSQENEI